MIKIDNKPSATFTFVVLVGLLICGTYLRFYNLGEMSFWVDEMNHVFAGMSLSEGEAPTFPSGVANERALLYSRMVGWTFSAFGVSEISARFPSAVLGLLSILLIFWVGKELFNRRVGLLAAFFLTFAHMPIGWSRTSRMYTLFQFLFLLAVYFYYRGFEMAPAARSVNTRAEGVVGSLRSYFRVQGIRWPWLIAAGCVFLLSIQVHQLTGLFGATLLVFWLLAFAGVALRDGFRTAFGSKYFVALSLTSVGVLVGVLFFDLGSFVNYALTFHPEWAQYSKVEDTHYYYWYLTSSEQFPLAALFVIGAVQALIRLDKAALFCTVAFGVPVFFQSFIFSYKLTNYIFNVYPFFVLIIAFGVHNLYESELMGLPAVTKKLGRLRDKITVRCLRWASVGFFFLSIMATVWFRVAIKIPLQSGVGNNGAITHYDWRGAAEVVSERMSKGDAVLSTLPLTVLFYLDKVDYNLNQAHLDESLRWETPATDGRHFEFYTGVPSVESVSEMQNVMSEYPQGWVIVDAYRLGKTQYVSPELAQFIRTELQKIWSDKKDIVQVYSWSTKQRSSKRS